MLELDTKAERVKPRTGLAMRERSRLLIALALLVTALAVVIVRDRDFWFGPDDATESDASYSESVPKAQPTVTPAQTAQAPVTAPAAPKNRPASKGSIASAVAAPPSKEAANSSAPAVVAKRAVLPPLDVEVIAGDTHSTVHPGSNIAKVEIPGASNRAPAFAASAGAPTNAADRELLSATDSTYPLLGQHMRVQGSVVLQAVVGTDGTIQNLRVLSGPRILTAAAQQAVREWRFKPYLQNGQPVETKATITVNFSIRVSGNPAKTS
jgi:periplasmic protein TonB